MAGTLAKVAPTEKDIKDEVAVRVASLVYVWDGEKGVFFDPDTFVELQKEYPCDSQEVGEGVVIAALKSSVPEPDWGDIKERREKDSKAETAYFDRVVRFRHEERGLYQAALLTYWDKGKFLDDLLKEPGKYGNKTAARFAEDLGVSESSARQYHRFACLYERDRAKELAGRRMTWFATTKLLSVESESERTKLEDSLLAKKIDVDDLSEAVKKINRAAKAKNAKAGKKVDRRGGQSLKGAFDSVCQMSDKLQDKLSEFTEGFKAFNQLSKDKQKPETKKSMKAEANSLLRLHRRLTKMVEAQDSDKKK